MVADVYDIYERDMHRMNAMDFDDLLFRTVNLFELFEEVRERYASAFRHVLVDEYQDTNHAQYRLLQLLVGGGRSARRGGARDRRAPQPRRRRRRRPVDLQLPRRRRAQHPGLPGRLPRRAGRQARAELPLHRDDPLGRQRRHREQPRRIAKRLWSELGQGEQIQLRALEDEHAEARFIVGEIERQVDEGASRSEIAVLYRTNAMSRVIEDTLVRREIAYQVIGGTKFYERAEIKDAIAYLSLLANPFDVVSFTRVANSPRRGHRADLAGARDQPRRARRQSVWDVASEPEAIPGLGSAAVKALGRFMDTMAGAARARRAAARAVRREPAPPSRRSGRRADRGRPLPERLRAGAGGRRTIEAQGRLENLEQLVEVGREFDDAAATGEDTLDVFLQQIALVADADTRTDDEGLVTLMTLHNAKGLEYPIVFIAGCEEGVFPHSRAIDEGGLEEERRLFYVGITRAMRSAAPDLCAPARACSGHRPSACAAASSMRSPRTLLEEPQRAACSGPRRCRCRAGLGRRDGHAAAASGGGERAWAQSAAARACRAPRSSASARTSCTPPSATAW